MSDILRLCDRALPTSAGAARQAVTGTFPQLDSLCRRRLRGAHERVRDKAVPPGVDLTREWLLSSVSCYPERANRRTGACSRGQLPPLNRGGLVSGIRYRPTPARVR